MVCDCFKEDIHSFVCFLFNYVKIGIVWLFTRLVVGALSIFIFYYFRCLYFVVTAGNSHIYVSHVWMLTKKTIVTMIMNRDYKKDALWFAPRFILYNLNKIFFCLLNMYNMGLSEVNLTAYREEQWPNRQLKRVGN